MEVNGVFDRKVRVFLRESTPKVVWRANLQWSSPDHADPPLLPSPDPIHRELADSRACVAGKLSGKQSNQFINLSFIRRLSPLPEGDRRVRRQAISTMLSSLHSEEFRFERASMTDATEFQRERPDIRRDFSDELRRSTGRTSSSAPREETHVRIPKFDRRFESAER